MQEVEKTRRSRGALRAGRRMTVPFLFVCLGLAAGSSALTVGDMQVRSTLGQPFSGVVRVEAAAGEAIRRECFSMGSYANAVPGVPVVEDIRFVLETSKNTSFLRLLGKNPVREPLAQVILQVRCPGLPRLTRTFLLLIDPASIAQAPEALPALSDVMRSPSTPASGDGRPIAGNIQPGSRYVVRAGDTLSGIAARIDGRPPYSVWPLAEKIRARNPSAFPGGRPDQLIAGASLEIPTLDGVSAGRGQRTASSALLRQPQAAAQTETVTARQADPAETADGAQLPADRTRSNRAANRLFDTPVLVGEPLVDTDLEYLVLTPVLSQLSRDRIAQRSPEPVEREPAPAETDPEVITPPVASAQQSDTIAEPGAFGSWVYWLLGLLLLLAAAIGAYMYMHRPQRAHEDQDSDSPWELKDDGELAEMPSNPSFDRPAGMIYDDFEGTFVSAEAAVEVTESRAAGAPTVDDPEKDVMTHLMPTVDDSAEHERIESEQPQDALVDLPKSTADTSYRSGRNDNISVTTLEESDDNVTEEGWVELDFEATQILEQDYLAEYAAKLKGRNEQTSSGDDGENKTETDSDNSADSDVSEVEFDEEPLLMAHEMLASTDDPEADSLSLAPETEDIDEEAPVVLAEPDDADMTAKLAVGSDQNKSDDNVVNIAEGKSNSNESNSDDPQPEERKKS